MFILGFGKKTFKILGESEERKCKSCSNERKFKYVEEKTWMTLFFIKVFSYKTRKIFICPVCSMGFQDKGDIEVLPVAVKKTAAEMKSEKESHYKTIKEKFDKGEISRNEFIRMCNILNFEIKTSY